MKARSVTLEYLVSVGSVFTLLRLFKDIDPFSNVICKCAHTVSQALESIVSPWNTVLLSFFFL